MECGYTPEGGGVADFIVAFPTLQGAMGRLGRSTGEVGLVCWMTLHQGLGVTASVAFDLPE